MGTDVSTPLCDTEAPFLAIDLLITNGIISSKIYDKQDDFNFEIVKAVPRALSYAVYISQLICFARICSKVRDFNFVAAKLLKHVYQYHKLHKAFSKFYRRHAEVIVIYSVLLENSSAASISEPVFYGDLVHKFKRIVGKHSFHDQFKKIVKYYKIEGYSMEIMRQSANLIMVYTEGL